MIRYFFLIVLIAFSCGQRKQSSEQKANSETVAEEPLPTTGNIEVLDSALFNFIPREAKIEIIAEGFDWAEGPVWLPEQQKLLFSDIPPNKIYQWSEASGLQLYLTPSGYTGRQERGGEVGSNGLLLDAEGRLVLCQHGDRRIARMEAPLDDPQSQFITLADN